MPDAKPHYPEDDRETWRSIRLPDWLQECEEFCASCVTRPAPRDKAADFWIEHAADMILKIRQLMAQVESLIEANQLRQFAEIDHLRADNAKLAPCTSCGGKMLIGQSGLVCSQCPSRIVPYDESELCALRRKHPARAIIVDDPEALEAEKECVCELCRGEGTIECEECEGTGVDECVCVECGQKVKCDVCGGKGTVPCQECSEDEEDWEDDDDDDEEEA